MKGLQPSQLKDNLKNSLSSAIEGTDSSSRLLMQRLLNNAEDIEKKIDTEEEEVEEAVGASSAGAYVGPLFGSSGKVLNKESIRTIVRNFILEEEKESEEEEIEARRETDEATTASSAGSYETPAFLAKSMSKKDWRGAAKPTYPGGKFVEVKKKCMTFPYCNQGDINALNLWEDKTLNEVVDKVSKKTGKNKKELKDMIKKEIKELIRKGFYKSPITDLLGPETKMDKPIGKIFTVGSNVGAKHE